MRKFLTSEKPKQMEFKMKSSSFSGAAQADGIYKDHTYPFCLPRQNAQENLFPLADKPQVLAALLRPIYPTLANINGLPLPYSRATMQPDHSCCTLTIAYLFPSAPDQLITCTHSSEFKVQSSMVQFPSRFAAMTVDPGPPG